MKDVIYQSKQLNAKIRQSNEYNHYVRSRKNLMQDENLYKAFNDFRRRNYEIQSRQGEENYYDDITDLVRDYDSILKTIKVNDFLVAEQRICRLMQEIYSSISDSLDFDYDFIDE